MEMILAGLNPENLLLSSKHTDKAITAELKWHSSQQYIKRHSSQQESATWNALVTWCLLRGCQSTCLRAGDPLAFPVGIAPIGCKSTNLVGEQAAFKRFAA